MSRQTEIYCEGFWDKHEYTCQLCRVTKDAGTFSLLVRVDNRSFDLCAECVRGVISEVYYPSVKEINELKRDVV